jgi:hypothetical protein
VSASAGSPIVYWAEAPKVGETAHRNVQGHGHTIAFDRKTPQALGLPIPPHLLPLADEVLQEKRIGDFSGHSSRAYYQKNGRFVCT